MVSGGELIARQLAAEGVDTVFGIIDGTYFGLYSSFERHGIRLVSPRHESSGVHMAAAFARQTGRLGVCLASNGPGVANALPGVAVEQAEGNRVLLITSSRRHAIVEPDRGGTFQCFPQVQAIGAMSKLSVHVPSADRIGELTRQALRACFTGRPGVVHLDVPEDLFNGQTVDQTTRAPDSYRATEPLAAPKAQIRRLTELLRAARRPLIHAGSGVLHAQAYEGLLRLARRLGCPITTSWAARAVVDERDPNSVPMVYLDTIKRARNEADLVLVLGSRLGETDWWGKAPYWASADRQKLVQVDIDGSVLGNIRPTDLAVQADVGVVLDALDIALRGHEADDSWLRGLRADCQKRRRQLDSKHLDRRAMPMRTAVVPGICQEVLGDDAIAVLDGGNTAVWGTFFTEVRSPNSLLSTPKMGMLGAGCSQPLAAKLAHPDRPVYCILGDGAMGFHAQEVETAVRNGLQVIWLVVCDKQWGMVKINQQFKLKPIKTLVKGTLSPEETINTDLGESEFDALARALGAHGERVADPAGLEGALRRSVASGLPAVIHLDVDPVKHLWAPHLKTFQDMHQEPAG